MMSLGGNTKCFNKSARTFGAVLVMRECVFLAAGATVSNECVNK
jgi:hypothetical protein